MTLNLTLLKRNGGLLFLLRAGTLSLAIAVLVCTMAVRPAGAKDNGGSKGQLRVMTCNVDEGTDYIEALSATNYYEFLQAATTIWNNVQATNPPERAKAIAVQIGRASPTLVTLEEATQWQTCPTVDFQSCAAPPTTVYDILQLIMAALQQ